MSAPILRLNLKRCYFEQIRDGSKAFEYRLADKWEKRLAGREFSAVQLALGYPAKTDTGRHLLRRWKGYTVQTITHPHFGNVPVRVCAIDVSEPLEQRA